MAGSVAAADADAEESVSGVFEVILEVTLEIRLFVADAIVLVNDGESAELAGEGMIVFAAEGGKLS